MSLSHLFECGVVLSKAALSCSGVAAWGGLLVLESVVISFPEHVVSVSLPAKALLPDSHLG